jgi:hypothetical protein
MVWRAYVLGEDGFGTWLFTPEGSIVRGRRGGEVGSSYVGVPDKPGLHVLHLVPVAGWWFGTWANDGFGQRIAIDICTPPVHIDGEWLFDDLELDLYRRGSRLGVFDEDEFDDGYAAGHIGPDEAEPCRGTASELHHRLRDGDALFDSVGWDRLQAAIALGLAPLAIDLSEP